MFYFLKFYSIIKNGKKKRKVGRKKKNAGEDRNKRKDTKSEKNYNRKYHCIYGSK